jgi:DNA repair exonuclease SbcCD ATPase subunit
MAEVLVHLGAARAYEAAADRYQHDLARYEDVAGRAREARELSEGYGRGAQSLKNVRVAVKAELAPSLSKAASSLITAMTKGERRFVDVDEDFNITVDGQPLQTLSGSGKSVVNLALRLGLGQVLTSKVLPFFLGDEIDKDMDAVRAAATSETMMNLREYLSQIIIVTHKQIDADHLIQV